MKGQVSLTGTNGMIFGDLCRRFEIAMGCQRVEYIEDGIIHRECMEHGVGMNAYCDEAFHHAIELMGDYQISSDNKKSPTGADIGATIRGRVHTEWLRRVDKKYRDEQVTVSIPKENK